MLPAQCLRPVSTPHHQPSLAGLSSLLCRCYLNLLATPSHPWQMGLHVMSNPVTPRKLPHSCGGQLELEQRGPAVCRAAEGGGPEHAAAHLQAGRCDAMRPHKLHDKDMHAQMDWPRAADAGRLQAGQVSELLLCPELHHFPRIALAVAAAEAEVPLHIPGHSTAHVRGMPATVCGSIIVAGNRHNLTGEQTLVSMPCRPPGSSEGKVRTCRPNLTCCGL